MNIVCETAIQDCTSCQMCAAVCAQNAISIHLNEDGFYRPYIDNDKCINCGICTKVCYKFDTEINLTSKEKENTICVYSAQNVSTPVLKETTSGGVADALAKALIQQGYTCIGVTYDDTNHRAEHAIATTQDQTDAFRGSKYIQSYSFDAFKHLVKHIRTTKFAIFGLPCHIYAIYKYVNMRNLRDNCILIDLFCHGCPSMLVWNKYEQGIKKELENKPFDSVQFRSKIRGWGNFHVAVKVDNKTAFVSSPKHDEFYTLFFSNQVLNNSCATCKLRSTMEYTDIRLGDYWGKRFLADKKGVSVVVIVSEKGNRVFDSIKKQFRTAAGTLQEVKVKQSYGKTYVINAEIREQMLQSLRDKDKTLKHTVQIYESKQGISYKLKEIIKHIDWHMPFDFLRLLKRFA